MKKGNIIRVFIIILFLIIVIPLLQLPILPNKDSFYWQNYWSVISAVLTAIIAILGIMIEIRYNREQKKNEKSYFEFNKKVEKYEHNLEYIRKEGCLTVLKWSHYLENMDNQQKNFVDLKADIVKLLYQYKTLEESNQYLRDMYKEENKSNDDMPDISDYKQSSELLSNVVNHPNFRGYFTEINKEFPDLAKTLNSFMIEEDNTIIEIKDSNDLNKDNDSMAKYPDILGDWIMNFDYAKEVNYLVGISINNKNIIAIYEVNNPKNIEGRVRFSSIKCIYDRDNYEAINAPQVFEKWTSRNPVLYYNMWFKKYKNEYQNELLKTIKESTDINNETLNINDDRNILVVKTNKYEPVNSTLVRNFLSLTLNDKEEYKREDISNLLIEKYPYLDKHPGVYDGVLDKLDNSNSTYIFNRNKTKRLIQVKNNKEHNNYKFVDI